MKLCYVLNQFPELSQTFVLRQIVDLLERGHEVDVIAARPGDEAAYHASLCSTANRYGLDQRTRYTGMPERLFPRLLKACLCVVPAALSCPRVLATALDCRRFGWFAATGSLLTMGLPLAHERRTYDAIVAHFGPQGILAQGLREMGILRGPLVTFFHAYDLTSAPRLAGRSMYRRLFKRGELQLAISQRGAEHLSALGAPPDKVRVHHMGVNVDTFHPPTHARSGATGEALRVVSIGRLVPKKGFTHGLEAVAKAKARGVHLDYSIYGSGPMMGHLDRLIDVLGLRGTARLYGPATQDELAEVLRSSSVLLAPSTTCPSGDEEGIPMVLMEALATALPVVATSTGGVAELVTHEQNGLLVREGDSDAVADALYRLSSSSELAKRLGNAGRRRVCVDFNENEQGRYLTDILRHQRDAYLKSDLPASLPGQQPGSLA